VAEPAGRLCAMNIGVAIMNRALAFGTPILWVALGEICAELAGVVNVTLDGMMVISALGAFAAAQMTHSTGWGLCAGMAVGGLAALPHAVASISLRANQFVSGLALAMFWPGVASLAGRHWVGITLDNPMQPVQVPYLDRLPVFIRALASDQSSLTYTVLIMAPALAFFFRRTRWGVIWRSVGESPEAADAGGYHVSLIRYGAVVLGGVLAGIGGAYLSLYYQPAWVEGATGGMGWIALSIVIFAGWSPLTAVAGALLFGALYYLSFRLQSQLEPHLLKVMPYLSVVLVLTLGAIRQRAGAAPHALGMPFFRGDR
jgi:simple sugar transport system permease protein